jgi:hypothetical protein
MKFFILIFLIFFNNVVMSQPVTDKSGSFNSSKNSLEQLRENSDPEKVRQKDIETVKSIREKSLTDKEVSNNWFDVNKKKIITTIGFLLVSFFIYYNFFRKK